MTEEYEVTLQARVSRTINAESADVALAEVLGEVDLGDTVWESISWEVVE